MRIIKSKGQPTSTIVRSASAHHARINSTKARVSCTCAKIERYLKSRVSAVGTNEPAAFTDELVTHSDPPSLSNLLPIRILQQINHTLYHVPQSLLHDAHPRCTPRSLGSRTCQLRLLPRQEWSRDRQQWLFQVMLSDERFLYP